MNQPDPLIVIFGITGDLSKRKLLPALYHLLEQGTLSSKTKIIGTSRKPITKEELTKSVELCVLDKDKECSETGLAKMAASLEAVQIDPDSKSDFIKLKETLDKFDDSQKRSRLFYMSIPSSAYEPIVKQLAASGINSADTRILLEKPFGYDEASAKKSINLVHEAFNEDQIYRIDHYLAKETAQNLLAFRLHNPIFTPLWNCQYIQSIKVRQFETIGIEGRTNFYEQTGALRDMIQSHLMQLLAITMMDVPDNMNSDSIHQAKQKFLASLMPVDPKDTIRAQYDSYRREVDNQDSTVETYVKIKLKSQSDTWADTLISIEHGKAMGFATADVTVQFKTPHERRHNSLTFRIQPNEGISLDLFVKEPGFNNNMRREALDFSYSSLFKDYPYVDAYERVLMDAINGDQSLFASDQEVLLNWKVLEPLIDAWKDNDVGLKIYKAGASEVAV